MTPASEFFEDDGLRIEHWFSHRVSYGETDAMSVLYYAEYFHIFERSRSSYIRALGTSYKDVEERGIMLPVREATCRYRSPARYDDNLQIHLYISEMSRASLTFAYTVYAEDRKKVLTTGATQHACANLQGKAVPMPEWFRNLCLGKGMK